MTSSDTSLVSATTTQNIGAVIGSTTLSVAALASASQATFGYTAPASAPDTLTIGNDQGTQSVAVTAGESNTQIANDINGDNNGVAYATVLSSGQLVISSRTTGDGSSTGTGNGNPITLSSSASGSLTPVSSQAGQDAEVYVNGSTTPSYSQTDTMTDAVPGVTLTLNGVTPTNSPVTITTGAPAPNTSSIIAAVQQFVSDYNNAIGGIQTAINTAPPSESNSSDASAYTGSLFGDPELEDMLGNIRSSVDQTDSSLTSGYQSLQELGISTGSSNGSGQRQLHRRSADRQHRHPHDGNRAESGRGPGCVGSPGPASSRRRSTTLPVRSVRSSRASAATTPRSARSTASSRRRPRCTTTRKRASSSSGPRSRRRSERSTTRRRSLSSFSNGLSSSSSSSSSASRRRKSAPAARVRAVFVLKRSPLVPIT